ncbi:abortive infection system antitoxin AbiGi family protein [Imperialibacter roseus]|uniref:Abortive infection system antitoxin AbiGi family protein n=1 Tax=Imperialibacter roseus TaxID=1324217 RepID=A0ABZ0ITQ3_9BACT|nr:abortive infection system antitoxin AbiGi family protein [Imperialibacter roseus]WOK07071.1 abortive infection system antitoxin AbiGi family protein [Imperialibacter roseus]
MSKLSSDSLFHFTGEIKTLFKILVNGIRPSYCIEDYAMLYNQKKAAFLLAVPMSCFCDIPLSQINNHTSTYGDYGIGLKKSWAEKHGITPVAYVYKNSKWVEQLWEMVKIFEQYEPEIKERSLTFSNGFSKKYSRENIHFKNVEAFGNHYRYILSFIKPYEGKLFRIGKKNKNAVKFYDEKEWRYVPPGIIPPFIPAKSYMSMMETGLDDELKSYTENIEQHYMLKFKIEDINHIILRNDSKISDLIKFIDQNPVLYDAVPEFREILLTKVQTLEKLQIDY